MSRESSPPRASQETQPLMRDDAYLESQPVDSFVGQSSFSEKFSRRRSPNLEEKISSLFMKRKETLINDHLNYSAFSSPAGRSRRVQLLVFAGVVAVIINLCVLISFFQPATKIQNYMSHHRLTKPPANATKGLVIASFLSQDIEWMDEIKDEWKIYRYIMDDPTAEYHPPINSGREAMAYLTFIIDHYDDLPDYVAFIHGHERSWHQPEPMQWRLPTLNLTALENDRYISFHCSHMTSCNPKPRLDFSAGFDNIDSTGRLIPWFWRFAQISDELPQQMSWPDGAQFAVSKAAIHSRTKEWWIRYRSPMLIDDERMDRWASRGYYWGLMHERLWHVAFGMNPRHCPAEDYCTGTQWSNGVLCDMYPALPIVRPWIDHKDVPDLVTCFKNDNGTKEWPMKYWSLCDDPDYAQSEHAMCPFEGWPIP